VASACKITGTVLCVLGVVLALVFVVGMVRDEEYHRAALVRDRNPGNVLFEAEYKGALVMRAFESVGVIVGILLVINGATLLGLGTLAQRVPRRKELRARRAEIGSEPS
jgi:hypothetical protein